MKSVIYITGEVDAELCETVRAEIDQALANGATKITFRINSPGGSVISALAMYDLISALHVETEAVVYGLCASAATYMLVACDKAVATPSASIMIHPCSGGLYGTIKEIEADLEYFASLQNRVLAIYASKTGKTPEEIEEIWEPAKYFTSQEALEFGLIDEIAIGTLTNQAEIEAQDSPETPQDENEVEDKPEEIKDHVDDDGAIFSLKNLVKKCKEIIKRPVVDEYDEAAELQNKLTAMAADFEALQMENKTIKEAMEANVAELKNKLDEVEEERTALFNQIEEQKKNIETTISNEVNNRLASMGYDEDDLATPTNEIEKINIADVVRNQGLDAALKLLVSRKGR